MYQSYILNVPNSVALSTYTFFLKKRNPDWKRSNRALFIADMILYMKNLKDSIRKLLELIN